MCARKTILKPNLSLIPLYGMGVFIALYIIAALNYPGGSWNDINHRGFSFWNNYLCDLLDEYALNGTLNTGRYYARGALGVLCLGLMFLWYHLPKLFSKGLNLEMMRYSGLLALVTTCFLGSNTHDLIVRIAGIFGSVAIITLTLELFKIRSYRLGLLGLVCILIFSINYYVYETGFYVKFLPIIQKFTFASFMIWFAILDVLLFRKINKSSIDVEKILN